MNIQEVLNKIKEEYSHEFNDPIERLQSNSEKALKYAEMLYRVNRKKNIKKILVEKKRSELYKNAKFNSSYLLKNKADVDSFIETDEEYMKIKNELKELEDFVQYLEVVVDVYKQRESSERLIFKAKTGIGG